MKTNFHNAPATSFEVTVTASGADLFYKENYPLMELTKKGEQFVIKGVYRKGEEQFILLLMVKAI